MAKIQESKSEFNKEVCEYRHQEIDKKFDHVEKQLQTDIIAMKNDILGSIRDKEEKISADVRNREENLKNKIIVTEKGITEKIDVLATFQNTLRGNGQPSIFESIRVIKFRQNLVLASLLIIFFVMVVGDYKGISVTKMRKFFGLESKQEETIPLQNPPQNQKSSNEDSNPTSVTK